MGILSALWFSNGYLVSFVVRWIDYSPLPRVRPNMTNKRRLPQIVVILEERDSRHKVEAKNPALWKTGTQTGGRSQ
jgi:hypothetical protein